jgi:hypothetical protein
MKKYLLATAFMLSMCAHGLAHEGYDKDCCSDKDCHLATYVKQLPGGGYDVKADNGDLIRVPKGFSGYRTSKDNRFHICYGPVSHRGAPNVLEPICFYIPGAV